MSTLLLMPEAHLNQKNPDNTLLIAHKTISYIKTIISVPPRPAAPLQVSTCFCLLRKDIRTFDTTN